MEIKEVKSSMINSVGYDKDKELLQITFKNGVAYDYTVVKAEVFDTLLAAPSVGKFFLNDIKGKYTCKKVEAIK